MMLFGLAKKKADSLLVLSTRIVVDEFLFPTKITVKNKVSFGYQTIYLFGWWLKITSPHKIIIITSLLVKGSGSVVEWVGSCFCS